MTFENAFESTLTVSQPRCHGLLAAARESKGPSAAGKGSPPRDNPAEQRAGPPASLGTQARHSQANAGSGSAHGKLRPSSPTRSGGGSGGRGGGGPRREGRAAPPGRPAGPPATSLSQEPVAKRSGGWSAAAGSGRQRVLLIFCDTNLAHTSSMAAPAARRLPPAPPRAC